MLERRAIMENSKGKMCFLKENSRTPPSDAESNRNTVIKWNKIKFLAYFQMSSSDTFRFRLPFVLYSLSDNFVLRSWHFVYFFLVVKKRFVSNARNLKVNCKYFIKFQFESSVHVSINLSNVLDWFTLKEFPSRSHNVSLSSEHFPCSSQCSPLGSSVYRSGRKCVGAKK